MSKLAQAIKKTDLQEFLLENNASSSAELSTLRGASALKLFNLKTVLLSRPECETNDDYVQVLPYVVVRKSETIAGAKVYKYLSYQRPNSGDETRLHDLSSLGWGGHIEKSSNDTERAAGLFVSECMRELREELSVMVLDRQIINALQSNVVLHYQPQDAVGKYHLCVGLVLDLFTPLQNPRVNEAEASNTQWLTKAEILSKVESDPEYTLEPWSTLMLAEPSVS